MFWVNTTEKNALFDFFQNNPSRIKISEVAALVKKISPIKLHRRTSKDRKKRGSKVVSIGMDKKLRNGIIKRSKLYEPDMLQFSMLL